MMVKLSKSSPIPAQSEFQQKKTFRICRGDFILAHYRGWWQMTKGWTSVAIKSINYINV